MLFSIVSFESLGGTLQLNTSCQPAQSQVFHPTREVWTLYLTTSTLCSSAKSDNSATSSMPNVQVPGLEVLSVLTLGKIPLSTFVLLSITPVGLIQPQAKPIYPVPPQGGTTHLSCPTLSPLADSEQLKGTINQIFFWTLSWDICTYLMYMRVLSNKKSASMYCCYCQTQLF